MKVGAEQPHDNVGGSYNPRISNLDAALAKHTRFSIGSETQALPLLAALALLSPLSLCRICFLLPFQCGRLSTFFDNILSDKYIYPLFAIRLDGRKVLLVFLIEGVLRLECEIDILAQSDRLHDADEIVLACECEIPGHLDVLEVHAPIVAYCLNGGDMTMQRVFAFVVQAAFILFFFIIQYACEKSS